MPHPAQHRAKVILRMVPGIRHVMQSREGTVPGGQHGRKELRELLGHRFLPGFRHISQVRRAPPFPGLVIDRDTGGGPFLPGAAWES